MDLKLFQRDMPGVHMGMKYQGAQKLIASLQGLGVLAELDDRVYDRRYQAPRVIEVLLRHR
ncbi:hypothetical protein AADG42_16370 [Ammonicoccus fulvus]|uniref:Uncharacterized protein n=1 Tax=Ammonicoccus fulvus TaxID=3138240 RepID=A0ABZ3FUQ1_9ACTN